MKPLTEEDAELISQLLTTVGGEVLGGVTYIYPQHWSETVERASAHVHEVTMDVLLDFESGKHLLVSWATGYSPGLALSTTVLPNRDLLRLDASVAWLNVLGKKVQEFIIAWHIPESDRPSTAWSLELTFSNGSSVSLFLGELRDGQPDYQPDSLLVFLDEIEASNYRKAMSRHWMQLPNP